MKIVAFKAYWSMISFDLEHEDCVLDEKKSSDTIYIQHK